MAISIADSSLSANTGSVVMNTPCAVGDLIAVFSQNTSGGGSYGTVSDNVNTGNYTQPASLQYINVPVFSQPDSVSYLVCNAVGTPTIVNSIGSGVSMSAVRLTGFVNTPTLDAISAWTIASGTAVSNSATTGHAGEMVLSFGTTDNNAYSGTPAGWTQTQSNVDQLTQTYYQLVASAGSVSLTGTLAGSSNWLSILVGFYDAGPTGATVAWWT